MSPRPGRLVLLGHPVGHSLSPAMQGAALRHAGLPLTYEALDVPPAALAATLDELAAVCAAGNVTIPHKQAVFARCQRPTPLATQVRAVNTFWFDDDGQLAGDNTDVGGFDCLVRRVSGAMPNAPRVAVLGAGGAAAAVLAAVSRWPGARVTLCNRTAARREQLAERFPVVTRTAAEPADAVAGCTIVVNATPVGLTDDAVPVAAAALDRDAVALDLVYRPGETAWVRAARARGLRAADGLAMLVEQGALAFERWFDRPAPRDVMWRAVCSQA